MKRTQISILVLITVLLAGCSGMKVATDQDNNIPLNDLRTFEFLDFREFDQAYRDIIIDSNKNMIQREIREELARKGFFQGEEPDFYITYAGYRESSNFYASSSIGGWGYWGPYYGPHWGPYGGLSASSENTSDDGTLMVALIDGKTYQMVWYGAATKVLNNNPQKTGKNIIKATKEILKSFPVSSPELNPPDRFGKDYVSPS